MNVSVTQNATIALLPLVLSALLIIGLVSVTSISDSMDDYSFVREGEPFISYWPKGEPPENCLVIKRNADGTVDLVELKKKLNRVKSYHIRHLPDSNPRTLYKIFAEARLPVAIAEVDDNGVWWAQIVFRE